MFKMVMAIILSLFAFWGWFSQKYTDTTQPPNTDSFIEEEPTNEMKNNCKLLLNGKEICSDCYVNINFEHQYAELPLIKILIEMGASVIWQNENIANISIKGNNYVLNTENITLKKLGSKSSNYLMLAPGSNHGTICKNVAGDFICDSDTISYFIVYELDAKMTIDYEQAIINIEI